MGFPELYFRWLVSMPCGWTRLSDKDDKERGRKLERERERARREWERRLGKLTTLYILITPVLKANKVLGYRGRSLCSSGSDAQAALTCWMRSKTGASWNTLRAHLYIHFGNVFDGVLRERRLEDSVGNRPCQWDEAFSRSFSTFCCYSLPVHQNQKHRRADRRTPGLASSAASEKFYARAYPPI